MLLLIAGVYWLARRRMGMGMGDVKLLAMLAGMAWAAGNRLSPFSRGGGGSALRGRNDSIPPQDWKHCGPE